MNQSNFSVFWSHRTQYFYCLHENLSFNGHTSMLIDQHNIICLWLTKLSRRPNIDLNQIESVNKSDSQDITWLVTYVNFPWISTYSSQWVWQHFCEILDYEFLFSFRNAAPEEDRTSTDQLSLNLQIRFIILQLYFCNTVTRWFN